MTKHELQNEGKAKGIQFADSFTEEQLRAAAAEGLISDAARETIRSAARSAAVCQMNFRSVDSTSAQTFIEAFAPAASARLYQRYIELPDVAEAQTVKWFERGLDRQITDYTERLANWQARFALDPADAFEWSDDSMKTAAQLKVATIIREVFLKDLQSADAGRPSSTARIAFIRKEALRKALESARYPQHSTSQPSNVMAAYVGAAWAEFARVED